MSRPSTRDRLVDRIEYDRRFRSICEAIFTSEAFFEIRNLPTNPVFRNPSWKFVPIPFELRFDAGADAGAMSQHGYRMADEYEPLFATLQARATAEIVLTTKPACPHDDLPDLACFPDRSCLTASIARGLADVPLPLQAFDESAEWGLCSNGEYDGYSIVAGTDSFMTELIGAYGGIERIKRRFWEFNTKFHNWPVDPDQRWCQDWEALGWGDVPENPPCA